MSWISFLAIFFVTWFLVLLMVLPVGVRRTDNPAVGHDAGAPERPYLWWKLLATTLVAILITAGLWWTFISGLVSFRPD